jgi:hypothetical protein
MNGKNETEAIPQESADSEQKRPIYGVVLAIFDDGRIRLLPLDGENAERPASNDEMLNLLNRAYFSVQNNITMGTLKRIVEKAILDSARITAAEIGDVMRRAKSDIVVPGMGMG